MDMNFEQFSRYWAGPITNIIIVAIIILLLYPLLWRLTIRQFGDIISSINLIKEFPKHLPSIIEMSEKISKLSRDLEVISSRNVDLNNIENQIKEINEKSSTISDIITRLTGIENKLQDSSDTGAIISNSDIDKIAEENIEDKWSVASDLWRSTRNWVESIISNISDGRVRRKYNSLNRYQYTEISAFLLSDGLLTQNQADALNEMDRIYRSIRNRRVGVTDEMISTLKRLRDAIVV